MASETGRLSTAQPHDLLCSECGRPMRRIARAGFLQKVILPWFGYYPWECILCRQLKYFHFRGPKSSRRRIRD